MAIFSLQYIAPGNVVDSLLGSGLKSAHEVAALRAEYHLNDSLPVQYWFWLDRAVHFDFGRSVITGQPVTAAIWARVPVTLEMATYGFVIAAVIGVGAGILCALRTRSLFDRSAVAIGVVGSSAPAFTIAILFIYIFTVKLGWFPSFGTGGGFFSRLYHLTLPALTLGLCSFALILKLTRAGVNEAMTQDYYAFARARGVRGWRLVLRYAFRTGLIPLITGGSAIFTYMLTAAVITEVAFSIPGFASLLVSSVEYKDVPVIQGATLFIGAIVILVNLVVDLSYRLVDPRVRLIGSER